MPTKTRNPKNVKKQEPGVNAEETSVEAKSNPNPQPDEIHRLITIAQVIYIENINALRMNMQNNSQYRVELREFVRYDELCEGLTESDDKVAKFFEMMSLLHIKKQDSRHEIDLDNAPRIVAMLIYNINITLSSIVKNHADKWAWMLNDDVSRLALYDFLITDSQVISVNVENLWKMPFLQDRSRLQERFTLEYLYSKNELEQKPITSYTLQELNEIKNPLVRLSHILQFYTKPDQRILAVEQWLDNNMDFQFPLEIPYFVASAIARDIGKLICEGIYSYETDLEKFIRVIRRLSACGILPRTAYTTINKDANNELQTFLFIYFIYRAEKIYTANYDISCELSEFPNAIIFVATCYLDGINLEKISATIIQYLNEDALLFMRTTELRLHKKMGETFWSALAKTFVLLAHNTQTIFDLNQTLDYLYQNKREGLANKLLTCFVKQAKMVSTPHSVLYAAILLINSLPDKDMLKCEEAVQVVVYNKYKSINFILKPQYSFDKLTKEFLKEFKHLTIILYNQLVSKAKTALSIFPYITEKKLRQDFDFFAAVQRLINDLLLRLDPNVIDAAEILKSVTTQVRQFSIEEKFECFKPDSNMKPQPLQDNLETKSEKKIDTDSLHRNVLEIQEIVLQHFVHVNDCVTNSNPQIPDIKKIPHTQELGDVDEILFGLNLDYSHIVRMIKLVKTGKMPISELTYYLKELYGSMMEVAESENSYIWNFFITNHPGRHIVYHLYLARIIHKEPDLTITSFLHDSLKSTSKLPTQSNSKFSEDKILEFLQFLNAKNINSTSDITIQEAIDKNNILIMLYLTLSAKRNSKLTPEERQEVNSVLIQTLDSYFKQSVCFEEVVPPEVAIFMRNIFFSLFMQEITVVPEEIPQFIPIMNKYIRGGFFPNFASKREGSSLQETMFNLYLLFINFKAMTSHYSLVDYPDSTFLHVMSHNLSYKIMNLFFYIKELGCISESLILNHLEYATDYLNKMPNDEEPNVLYVEAMVHMLSLMGQVKFKAEINKNITFLFFKKNLKIIALILRKFIAHNITEKKEYTALLAMVEFLSELIASGSYSDSIDGENVESVFQIKYSKFDILLAGLKKKISELNHLLQNPFIKKISNFIAEYKDILMNELFRNAAFYETYLKHIDYAHFQSYILTVASILQLDEKEFEKIHSYIHYEDKVHFSDQIFDAEVKDAPKKANKKKAKKQVKLPDKPASVSVEKNQEHSNGSVETALNTPLPSTSTNTFACIPEEFEVGEFTEVKKKAPQPKPVNSASTSHLSFQAFYSPNKASKPKSTNHTRSTKKLSNASNVNKLEDHSLSKPFGDALAPPKPSSVVIKSSTARTWSKLPPVEGVVKLNEQKEQNQQVAQVIVPVDDKKPSNHGLYHDMAHLFSTDDTTQLPHTLFSPALREFFKLIFDRTNHCPIVTGGSLISLIKGTGQINDYDLLMFLDIYELFKVLNTDIDRKQVYCEMVGTRRPIIKVILAEGFYEDCELLTLPYEPAADLSHIHLGSNAAYVCTPQGLYYVNKTTNECRALPFPTRVTSKPAMQAAKLKHFNDDLLPETHRVLTLKELRLIKLHTGHSHVPLVDLDISCYPLTPEESHAQGGHNVVYRKLQSILSQRDFQPTVLFSILRPGLLVYPVNSFNGAINALQNNLIKAVDLTKVFDDLTQLFRLGKLRLGFEDLEEDPDLKAVMIQIDFHGAFNQYIYERSEGPNTMSDNVSHLSQINTRFNEAFNRFDAQRVLPQLCMLPIIYCMFKINDYELLMNTLDELAEFMEYFPHDSKANAFYLYMATIGGHLPELNCRHMLFKLVPKTFKPLDKAKAVKAFANTIHFIENQHKIKGARGHTFTDFTPSPEFLEMFVRVNSKVKKILSERVNNPEMKSAPPIIPLKQMVRQG